MNQQTEPAEETENRININTKFLMVSSAVFLGLLGFSASFLPLEIAEYYGAPAGALSELLIEMTGALYLGFAVLNWMARGNIIGGIYSRPVALGNFFHFTLIALLLIKYTITNTMSTSFAIGGAICAVFALSFGYILFAGGKACG
jgi:hypothetical protein